MSGCGCEKDSVRKVVRKGVTKEVQTLTKPSSRKVILGFSYQFGYMVTVGTVSEPTEREPMNVRNYHRNERSRSNFFLIGPFLFL